MQLKALINSAPDLQKAVFTDNKLAIGFDYSLRNPRERAKLHFLRDMSFLGRQRCIVLAPPCDRSRNRTHPLTSRGTSVTIARWACCGCE